MTRQFNDELRKRLQTLREQGLYRELRPVQSPQGYEINFADGPLLNFASNDYLGLANHPALKEAACQAVERYGAGAGASRLICGSLAPCHALEERLAHFKGTEAALTFSTGYATALGSIGALMDKEDIIVLDKLVHASIVDAARLCGARMRVFRHNDMEGLEKILRWADSQKAPPAEGGPAIRVTGNSPQVLIVTESLFSMDGDYAPLSEIVALKEKYGAWLMVDEAHATGLHGPNRCGVADALGLSGRIEIQMGTLGKALGASGGFICGSRALIDLLVNRARSFIFSTAPVPAAAGAAEAAIALVQSKEGQLRCASLWERIRQLRAALPASWQLPRDHSPIFPLLVGQSEKALELAALLRERGLYVPAIRYPTVARDQARLRVTLSAAHTRDHVDRLVAALNL